MYCLTVLEAGSLKSRCQQAWFLPRALRENLVVALLLASDDLGCSWLVDLSLRSFTCTQCSSVCLCVQIAPLTKIPVGTLLVVQ